MSPVDLSRLATDTKVHLSQNILNGFSKTFFFFSNSMFFSPALGERRGFLKVLKIEVLVDMEKTYF